MKTFPCIPAYIRAQQSRDQNYSYSYIAPHIADLLIPGSVQCAYVRESHLHHERDTKRRGRVRGHVESSASRLLPLDYPVRFAWDSRARLPPWALGRSSGILQFTPRVARSLLSCPTPSRYQIPRSRIEHSKGSEPGAFASRSAQECGRHRRATLDRESETGHGGSVGCLEATRDRTVRPVP